VLVDGNPGREIAEVAKERGFDLVVMATHGRTGWSRFTLGSVAERALRSSNVPVLTLRVSSQAAS
jgi:nucleotide-binding universal stress UspA family protein